MIWYNEKERGVQVGDAKWLGLSITCARCRHAARVRRAAVLQIWGYGAFARDIAQSLKCTRCGAAEACVMVIAETRPFEARERDESYWGASPHYDEVEPLGALGMCNRYAADIRKAGLEREVYGFEEWSETRINVVLEVFPNSIGPVIRKRDDGELEWVRMRWGLPGPASKGGFPVTNVRNLNSPHWRSLLGPAHRCLVPFTAFSEYEDASLKGKKVLRWFASRDRGVLSFAGLWRSWRGDRGTKNEPNVGEHLLFSFLTTDPNDLARPIHAKAMPVILQNLDDENEWLTAPVERVPAIQSRVLPNSALELLQDHEAEQFTGSYIR